MSHETWKLESLLEREGLSKRQKDTLFSYKIALRIATPVRYAGGVSSVRCLARIPVHQNSRRRDFLMYVRIYVRVFL